MEEGTAPEKLVLVSVMIDVQGDFANRAELKTRDAIQAKLNSLGIGQCVGSGSGMGMMDVSFLLDKPDAEAARQIIEQAMATAFPGQEFTLDFSEIEGDRSEFLPEKSGCRGSAAAAFVMVLAVAGLLAPRIFGA
jgi:hypothetical protein